MKILAVIPARAGSKGIPNKNIRLVNQRPLICYAIENALSSGCITDVVVTTDSPEVRSIAEQMGVNVRWRDASLCGDDVTLDGVVFDALTGYEDMDYVVTMQPTSPTLLADTLDRAIKEAIDGDYDTMISVIDRPHLSWKEENGVIVPAYEKRVNRQYLPHNYMETGAFVIAKRSVVTADTRFGAKVGVSPLSDEEAVDIDTYLDLQTATYILQKRKVAIYVNGNNTRGMGHVYRALELADEFFCEVDIIYDKNQTEPSAFGSTKHILIPVDGEDGLIKRCKYENYGIIINDVLSTDASYMKKLRDVMVDGKIINFEDDGDGAALADLVINALYDEATASNIRAGERYFIPAKPFMFYNPIQIRDKVENMLISFGGADPQGYTDRILKMIQSDEYKKYQFTVILGRSKKNVDELMKYNEYPHIEVLFDVPNMAEKMSSCDVAVTSRGRTAYELALLGIPTIAMSQNETEEKHRFVCNENGFSYIGLCPSDEVIEHHLKMYLQLSKKTRMEFQDKLLSHNLKNGRENVRKLIQNL